MGGSVVRDGRREVEAKVSVASQREKGSSSGAEEGGGGDEEGGGGGGGGDEGSKRDQPWAPSSPKRGASESQKSSREAVRSLKG